MHIAFTQRKAKETKALPKQVHYTPITSTKKTVLEAESWVRKYHCDLLLWKEIIILNYILFF